MLLPKFKNLALPADFKKSKPTIKKANSKNEPVPGPKKPSQKPIKVIIKMKPAYRLGVSLLYVEMLPQSFLKIIID